MVLDMIDLKLTGMSVPKVHCYQLVVIVHLCVLATDTREIPDLVYSPCNGVVSHGAQIGGLRVFSDHTSKTNVDLNLLPYGDVCQCVHFTPPSGDTIPYGNIIICSIRKNPRNSVWECPNLIHIYSMSPEGSISRTEATLTLQILKNEIVSQGIPNSVVGILAVFG